MTLPDILRAARQWWWVLVLCPIAAAGLAYFGSNTLTPIYESQATAMIEHQQSDGTQGLQNIQAAERRTQTFTQLVVSRSVLERVIEATDINQTVTDLRSDVSVSHRMNSQLITVAVQNPDPETAALVANAVVTEFAAYVEQIQASPFGNIDGDLDEVIADVQELIAETEANIAALEANDTPLTLAARNELERLTELLAWLEQAESTLLAVQDDLPSPGAAAGSQVLIVETAAPSSQPISPRIMLNTALAGMLGLLFGGAVVVGLSWIDENVKTEQDLRRLLERPVIGTVPLVSLPDQMESAHAGRSLSGEIFRGLRTNLQFTMVDRNIKSIVVTSVGPGEGKTTIAANLAIVLAQGGQRVILVDADMRRPRVHSLFHKVRNDRGLSNLLLQSPAVIDNVVQTTAISNLRVLATGPLPPNPPDLFGSSRMRALVNALEETADIVIFDSPPLALSESLLLSSLADGILFIVRAGKNRTSEVSSAFESASQTGVPVLGVVLNGVPSDSRAAHRVYQQYYPQAEVEEAIPQPKRRSRWLGRVFSRGA
jgi:polysaccharide biosynthesis transport protein